MNPGDILDGRYQIIARLGAGGMGEVYKATHVLLGASRVIKVVHPHIAGNTDALDRFLREARVATKVQHPNVATLHDFAVLPDGSHYMVWEFIDGENLAQRLRTRGTLPPRQALRIAVQALHGLEAIHRAGIIHRDISPENLMILPDDSVKIIDLGVAKLEDPDAVSQTRTGIFVGKLRYAAPEQLGFLGEDEKIDARADLYALAMVVVELLTGRPPYEAKSPHEYFLHHARELPQTTVELPATLPGSEAMQQVLQKALSRNRAERYASASDFAAALEEIARTLPDPVNTATLAIPLDGDETWRPSMGLRETVRTPAPAVPTEPVVFTEPAVAAVAIIPPPARTPLILIAAFLAALIVAGGAFALWPKITQVIAPSAKTPPPAVPQTRVAAATPQRSESTIAVTSTTVTESAAAATPLLSAPKPQPPRQEQHPAVAPTPERVDEERPAPTRNVPLYVDGPGRHSGNERSLDRLREELRGVNEVALLAGRNQVPVYRALHRYIPNLTFDADAKVVIRFDDTPERLGLERQHLTASATIEKNGRVIFRYDLPSDVDPGAAADAFAQTIAEAFE